MLAFLFVSLDFSPCGSGEFQCSNQVCIDEKQRCDGKTDCDDNSDEIDCGNNPHVLILKLSNGAKTRNRYNQVPHLTQDTY